MNRSPQHKDKSRLTIGNIALLFLAFLFGAHYGVLCFMGDPFNFGTLGSLLVCIGCTAVYLIRRKTILLPPLPKSIKRITQAAFGAWIISFIVVVCHIGYHSLEESRQRFDYLLVLGAGLNGSKPSLALQARLDTAAYQMKRYPHLVAIVSGGQGHHEDDTEAAVMKRVLIRESISPSRIIEEDRATSTLENIQFAKEILDKKNADLSQTKIGILTNDFHLFRTKLLARHNGLNPVGIPAETPWIILPNVYFREYFAVLKTLLLDLN